MHISTELSIKYIDIMMKSKTFIAWTKWRQHIYSFFLKYVRTTLFTTPQYCFDWAFRICKSIQNLICLLYFVRLHWKQILHTRGLDKVHFVDCIALEVSRTVKASNITKVGRRIISLEFGPFPIWSLGPFPICSVGKGPKPGLGGCRAVWTKVLSSEFCE